MNDSEKKNLKVVVDGFLGTVCNNRQLDRALEFIHPDFIKHYHDGKPDGNIDQVMTEYKGLIAQYPDVKSVVKKSIASGDEVWCWTTIEGLPAGFELDIVEICRVEDGRVREKWDVHQQKIEQQGP
jgi:predicted SnoaL-like aldol condensation-catalyzing enzyme